jgi:tetratricopeptide (TPR) repeat protein
MKKAVLSIFLWLTVISGFAQEKRIRPEKLYADAEAAFDAGEYAKAIAVLNDCLLEAPGFMDAYLLRAQSREQLKDPEGALTDYSIFLERQPAHTEALLNRAIIRYQLKKFDQAKEDFEKLLTLPPGVTQSIYYNKSAHVGGVNQLMTAQSQTKPLIYNYLGLIEFRLQHFQQSITWLDSAIALDPKEADYLVNRALAKGSLGDSTAALQDYRKALAINPHHALALSNASLLAGSNKLNDVDDPVTLAIESDSSMLYPYLRRAHERIEGGFYRGALEDLSRALEIEDQDAEIWFTRGVVNERLQNLKEAFSDYTAAITIKENHFKSWINRANVLLKMKRYKDAVDDYTVALIYQPEYGAAYYNRAIAKQYLGQLTEACDDLKKAEAQGMAVEEKMKKQFCSP